MIKIPGQQETLQFNKYNDWLQVCIPGHELIAFVFIFTILIINFTLEAGNSFVKEISLISIGGLFELRRVTPAPRPPHPNLPMAEFGWAAENCSGDKVIRVRVWEVDNWSRVEKVSWERKTQG